MDNQHARPEQLLGVVKTLLDEVELWYVNQQANLEATYHDINGRIRATRMRICEQPSSRSSSNLCADSGMGNMNNYSQAIGQRGNRVNAGSKYGNATYSPFTSTTASLNPSTSASPIHHQLSSGGARFTSGSGIGTNGSGSPLFGGELHDAELSAAALSNAAMRSYAPAKRLNLYTDSQNSANGQFLSSGAEASSLSNTLSSNVLANVIAGVDLQNTSTPARHTQEESAEWSVVGTPMVSRNTVSPTASPQAGEKMPVETVLSRIFQSMTDSADTENPFKFGNIYEQLLGMDDATPPQRESTLSSAATQFVPSGAAAAIGASGSSHVDPSGSNGGAQGSRRGAGGDGHVLTLASLRALHNFPLTTSIKAETAHGRPHLVPILGGAQDNPKKLGIDLSSKCEVFVEFKRRRVVQYKSDVYVAPGTYVVVGGDRGEDLGLVIYVWCESKDATRGSTYDADTNGSGSDERTKDAGSAHSGTRSGNQGVVGFGLAGSTLPDSISVDNGKVLRRAKEEDVQFLHECMWDLEQRAVEVCAMQVLEHGLPMAIVDAEYQFDKKKLTFFYEAQQRLDFRELVRDLYKSFRARIWMELVEN